MLRAILSTSLALGLFAAAQVARVHQNRRFDQTRRVLDDAQIPHPTVARLVSLGHAEWMTDLLWINATLYYSDTLYARLPSRYLRSYTRAMTELDPSFRQVYLWGALALVYRTSNVTLNDVRDAVAVLRQGLTRFPNDPELRGQLGVYLAFELGTRLPPDSEERRRSRAEAGEALHLACEAGWGPPWMALAAANLLVEDHREDDAISLLQGVLYRVETDELRARVEGRIESLRRENHGADAMLATMRELESTRRTEAPWISPSLFVFVGSTPLQRRGGGPLGVPHAATP